MLRPTVFALCVLSLAACRDDEAALPSPTAMTAEAVGHYCQMGILEHEGPKAQAYLEGLPTPLFFSQVRDVVAYMRMPEQSHVVTVAYVSDMGVPGATWDNPGPENWINAAAAHYVIGSAVTGGMGTPEIVPFLDRDAALIFAAANGGDVMGLADIPDSAVLAPADVGDTAAEEDFLRRLEALSSDEES
ncbi:copper resistance protein CopZ [Jannaschia sp. EhC01]|nr:copper resistance protein CopZ [Jannaschia sp. EhC01]